MTWPELGALLLFATAMSFTPGPNTTLSAAIAANLGLRPAMRFVFAVPVGWGLMLAACAGGLGALVAAAPALTGAIKLAGLAYMLWLALKLLRSSAAIGSAVHARLSVGFMQGVALQFVNIKAWMAALTVSAGWVAVRGPNGESAAMAQIAERLLIVLPVMMAYAVASNFSYALIGASLRGWLSHGQRLMIFNRTLAALLVVTAAWMAWL